MNGFNMKFPAMLILMGAFVSPAFAKETFYTPKQDLDGLEQHVAVHSNLPNVLIIGDSISMGYTKPVIALLKDSANVQRAPVNCGDSNFGNNQLNSWVGETQWDVIHFNFGLHDMCYRHPESKEIGQRDKVKGTQAVPLNQYKANLESLVLQLEATGATLIWASTTPVPENEVGRVVGDDLKYNAVAGEVMRRHGIEINDLHALAAGFGPELKLEPGNVHFNKTGSAKLAEQVAGAIKAVLCEGSNHAGE